MAGAPRRRTDRPGRLRSAPLLRSGAVLALATLAANALGYALLLVLTRALGPADYGAVAALLNLVLIGSVPALAVQLVAARRTARAGSPGLSRELARIGTGAGAVLGGVVIAGSPLVERFLHLDSAVPAMVLGAGLLPTTLTFAVQGILQGSQRFGRLALSYLVAALARFGGGALAALVGAGVTGVMAATSAGAFLTAAVTMGLEPDARPWGRRDVRDRGLVPEVLAATVSTAGLLSLVNVDVLLARHTLAPAAAGLYAAGAVFTKATYWGPQFLATLLYARMAGRTARRRAVTAAVLLTVGGGAAGVLAVAVAGVAAVRLVSGPAYVGLGRTVALFAAFGTALAVVQVLVYAGLAVGDRRLGVGAWLAVGAATAAVLGRPGLGVTGLVGTMLVVTSALAVAGLVLVLRGTRGGGDDGGSGPAVRDAPARAGS